jgi:PAS domain S-box-containing protein
MAVPKLAGVAPGKFPQEYLERLIESSPDIVIAVDRNGTVFFYNDGAEKTLGFTAPEILGQSVVRLYPSLDEARRVMAAMRSEEHGGPGKVKNFETTFVDRFGRHFPVAISGSILYDDAGLEIGSIGFARDLTELKSRDRLATLGEVVVGMSHEINSPLEVILNQVELLDGFIRRAAGDAEAEVEEERIDSIRRELRKVQEILGRLEEMSRGGKYATREYLSGAQMTDFATRPSGHRESDLAGLRILVVDDDLGVCGSLRDLLLEEGCQVMIAGGGLDAMRILAQQPVDLVISDVVMPDLDGYDLFMEVKRTSTTPVILMTGYYYDKDHVIKRSRLEGVEGVIFKKPIDPGRLKETIRQQCGRGAATPA